MRPRGLTAAFQGQFFGCTLGQLQDELPEGDWLTVYVRGDHSDAAPWYRRMLAFAAKRQLKPAGYGIERTLSDSTLSSDPQLHITEVQIPLNKAG